MVARKRDQTSDQTAAQAGCRFKEKSLLPPTGWDRTVPHHIGTPSCSGEMPNRAPQTPSRRRFCLARAGAPPCATALSSLLTACRRAQLSPRRPTSATSPHHDMLPDNHRAHDDSQQARARMRARTYSPLPSAHTRRRASPDQPHGPTPRRPRRRGAPHRRRPRHRHDRAPTHARRTPRDARPPEAARAAPLPIRLRDNCIRRDRARAHARHVARAVCVI